MAEEVNLDNLSDLEDLKKAHNQLCLEEEGVSKELENLLEQRTYLENKMFNLFKMLPNLQLVHCDSQQLSNMISFTSTLAENISSKVRQLDLAKSRVTDCMNHIEDILDLKFCTDGVKTALQNEDYEQAAIHIHRFLSLDENVLKHSAQDVAEGSNLDNSFSLLHDAESKLKKIVTRKFDEAVSSEDIASVERFFKIFPLLNQHEEGLRKFSQYLCTQIADTSQKNLKLALNSGASDKRANILFADTITLLFEGIARIVEIHQTLIETYYGPGYLILAVEIMQRECDRQVRRIIEEFKKSRNLQQRINTIQRLLSSSHRTVDRLDPKELDTLLSELTLLNARSELYLRFIRRRLMNDIEALPSVNKQKEKLGQMEKLLKDCELSRLMQELLGHYIMIEEYFMRESITKAVKMDIIEEGSLTSNVVDDVFFILKKCIKRALSSSSVDGVCALINNSCTVLEADFWEVLHTELCVGFPSNTLDLSQAYTVIQSSLQQGKLSTDEPEKAKMIFLVTINNAEVAIEYIVTLKKTTQEEIERQLTNCKDHEKAKLESCLSDLGNLPNKFKSLIEFGMNQLATSALKPRIKPWLDTFNATSHVITEDDFSNYEANDPFVQNFIMNIDGLLSSFKNCLTTSNYDSLISILTHEVTYYLEKIVFKTTFNRLGGLQFDKEIRALITYFTNMTTWTVRDKFARLIQIATILNLEKVDEILDYWGSNSGSLTWRLTPNEVRQILSLRVDFDSKDIRRLKL